MNPTVSKNLISVGQMVEKGYHVIFNENGCFIKNPKEGFKVIAQGKREGRMFTLDIQNPYGKVMYIQFGDKKISELDLWHKRIGHINIPKLKNMSKHEVVRGLPNFNSIGLHELCEACQLGKQTRQPFKRSNYVAPNVLDLIHTDVWGPTRESSMAGNRFFVTFIDDHSRKVWLFCMKQKSDVFSIFKRFKNEVEKETGRHIKILRSDGGGEYFSNEFSDFLQENGIKRQFTCRYTPQQNGVAERKNRQITEVARCMLNEMKVPLHYWAEATTTAVYLMNRCTTSGIHNLTPEETHLKVFGCVCFVHIPQEVRTKMEPRSEKCIFIGYSMEQKGYKCYNPITKEVRVSRDVVFDELRPWYEDKGKGKVLEEDYDDYVGRNQSEAQQSSTEISYPEVSTSKEDHSSWKERHEIHLIDDEASVAGNSEIDASENEERTTSKLNPNSLKKQHSKGDERRSSRIRYPIQRLTYDSFMAKHFAYMMQVVKDKEPETYEEACTQTEWKQAMKEEIKALKDNHTWDLVTKKEGMKIIPNKWVFKVKRNVDGSLARYKARLVAKGFKQTQGIDYDEIFSPVAKMGTIRTLIAISASKRWPLYQLDIKNAFLNGELQEEVYMSQPVGFEDKNYPDFVCRLKKALYGLKQAPRAWNQRLVEYLNKCGYNPSTADPSLYMKKKGNKEVYICIYVDDFIITGNDDTWIKDIKGKLGKEFKISDLGELKYFLGIEVVYGKSGIYLMQRKYLLDVLFRFGMSECKPLTQPIDTNTKLCSSDGEILEDATTYRSIIGSLIYASITRPDLCYVVGVLSQFMQAPTNEHLNAAKRVLRYIKHTINHALFYKCDEELQVKGFSDADWAGSKDDRRSTSGYVFMIGSNPITWSSKKQPTVALSSMEAEYRGLTFATCEAMWLKKLLADLEVHVGIIPIYGDNMASIYLASNPTFHARSKHIEVHYHYVREKVLSKDVEIKFIKTKDQVADMFTKFLDASKLKGFKDVINLQDMAQDNSQMSLRGSVEDKCTSSN